MDSSHERPGRKPSRDTLSFHLSQLASRAGKMAESFADAVPRKHASRLHLDELVTSHLAARQLASLDPRPYPKDFRTYYDRSVAEIDCRVVCALVRDGFLGSLLTLEGESVAWMFQPDGGPGYDRGVKKWAGIALDNRRDYYRAVLRFWYIFVAKGIQVELVNEISLNLMLVSIAFGSPEEALTIYERYFASIGERTGSETLKLKVKAISFQATALNVLGRIAEADARFEFALAMLEAGAEELQERSRNEEEETSVKSLQLRLRRTILREQLRSEIRPAWTTLVGSDWPQGTIARLRLEKAERLFESFHSVVMKTAGTAVPLDWDTLSRTQVLLHPNEIGDRRDWIGKADTLYHENKNQHKLEASLLTYDSLLFTKALDALGRGDSAEAKEHLEASEAAMPAPNRFFNLRAWDAIRALIERSETQ